MCVRVNLINLNFAIQYIGIINGICGNPLVPPILVGAVPSLRMSGPRLKPLRARKDLDGPYINTHLEVIPKVANQIWITTVHFFQCGLQL